MPELERTDFGWYYPPGVTEEDFREDEEEDEEACFPYPCKPGKPCYEHYED